MQSGIVLLHTSHVQKMVDKLGQGQRIQYYNQAGSVLVSFRHPYLVSTGTECYHLEVSPSGNIFVL